MLRWLQEAREGRVWQLGFNPNEVSLLSVGIGVATVSPGRKCMFDHLPTGFRFNLSLVYLPIGENDFQSSFHCPSVVAARISSLVDRLSSRVPVVCISQSFSFPAAADRKHDVFQCNNELKSKFCHLDTVQFCRHREGFWNQMDGSRKNLFNSRGVHLNEEGHKLYWHSVRVAVSKGRKRFSTRSVPVNYDSVPCQPWLRQRRRGDDTGCTVQLQTHIFMYMTGYVVWFAVPWCRQ